VPELENEYEQYLFIVLAFFNHAWLMHATGGGAKTLSSGINSLYKEYTVDGPSITVNDGTASPEVRHEICPALTVVPEADSEAWQSFGRVSYPVISTGVKHGGDS
jgi:hypothetical protein